MKKWVLGKRYLWRKPRASHQSLCGKECVRCLWTAWVQGHSENWWNTHVWETAQRALWHRKEAYGCTVCWALLRAVLWPLMPNERLVSVRKLEEGLRLEKDVHVSATLLTLGQAEKDGEQDNELEPLTCCFARLVTRLDWNTWRWSPEKVRTEKRRMLWWMTDWPWCRWSTLAVCPLIQRKAKT